MRFTIYYFLVLYCIPAFGHLWALLTKEFPQVLKPEVRTYEGVTGRLIIKIMMIAWMVFVLKTGLP